jgi:hypothetical protein
VSDKKPTCPATAPAAVGKIDDESNSNTEAARERGGENILFGARLRSKVAKRRGDALGDLDHRDVDRAVRHPAPARLAEVGMGGELVPTTQDELLDTVTNPDYVTVDASRDRLNLADLAGVLELALDTSDTIGAKNSLEKMLAHQISLHHETDNPYGGNAIAVAVSAPWRIPGKGEEPGNLPPCWHRCPPDGVVSIGLARVTARAIRRSSGGDSAAHPCWGGRPGCCRR